MCNPTQLFLQNLGTLKTVLVFCILVDRFESSSIAGRLLLRAAVRDAATRRRRNASKKAQHTTGAVHTSVSDLPVRFRRERLLGGSMSTSAEEYLHLIFPPMLFLSVLSRAAVLEQKSPEIVRSMSSTQFVGSRS